MTILNDINQYCLKNSDEFDTIPDSFNCSEIISYDTGEFEGLRITGFWRVTEMNPYGMADVLDEEQKEGIVTRREMFQLSESDELYEIINKKISALRSNITLLENGKIKEVSFNKHSEPYEQYDSIESPFYDIDDYVYSSFASVSITKDRSQNVDKPIRNLVQQELKDLDPDITNEQIVSIECSFDDFAICDLLSIRGHVVTEHPYRYYSDVESLDEYVNVLTDTEEEYDELYQQDNYHVFYRLDDYEVNEPRSELTDVLEPIMDEQMHSNTVINGEYLFEAESIILDNYESYPEHKTEENSFTGYDAAENQETIHFFVRQPFDKLG